MKRRIYNIDQKILVKGDPNLLKEHELLIDEDIKNGKLEVSIYKKNAKGDLESVTPTGGTITSDDWDTINSKAYGIEWTLFGETSTCKRIGNMEYHRTLPCHQWKGCIANAEKINYYLDANDWSKKEDGTPSVLDGSEGTVRVEIPTFYYKSWKIHNNTNPIRRVMISPEKIDDSWHEFPHILLDAYYATLDLTNPDKPKGVSVVNTTPEFRGGLWDNDTKTTSNEFDALIDVDPRLTDLGKAVSYVTPVEASNFAKNADAENICYDIYKMVVFWMPAIEYADLLFNYKSFTEDLDANGYHTGGLGKGCITMNNSVFRPSTGYDRYGGRTPNGFTNEFGNNSGVKLLYTKDEAIHKNTAVDDATTYTVPNDVEVVRYRGIENLWGDTGYFLEGLITGGSYRNTSNPENFTNDPNDRDILLDIQSQYSQDELVTDFILNDSCELLGIAGFEQYSDKTQYSTVNSDKTGILSVYINGSENEPLVFAAGGYSSLAADGGPGILPGGGRSLDYVGGGSGFRTLSRVNGDSKKLKYREVI